MSQSSEEKKVLEKFGVQKFSQVTKDMIINLSGSIEKLDPKVAVELVKQIPEAVKGNVDYLAHFKDVAEGVLEKNTINLQEVFKSYDTVIASCEKELEKDNISDERKDYLRDKMSEAAEKKALLNQKNNEENHNILKETQNLVMVMVLIVGALCGVRFRDK